MSSAITTTLPLLYEGPFVAEVIGAEATATTYVLNCDEKVIEDGECGTFNNTVAVGPWGSKTLPPGAASTGYLDYYLTMPDPEDPFEFSIHCKMSRTIAQECTTTNLGGNDDGNPTATFSDLEKSQSDFAMLTYATVTITAGQEFLAATHSAATTGDDASSTAKSASDATSVKESGAEATGTETQGTPTPKATSGASSNIVRGFVAMAVAGVATLLVSSDFADECPGAEIIGTDLSPIQPTWVPPNIKFELEDATGTWSWPENTFDFVHLRYLFGAIADWSALFADAYRTCKPGGCVQPCEIDPPFYSGDGTVEGNTAMQAWNKVVREGGIKFGRTFCVVHEGLQVPGLEAAGFVDIQQQNFKAKDPKPQQVGQFLRSTMENDMEGYTMILWHQVKGWPKDEYQVFLMGMRKALRDKRIHSSMNLRYVWARKQEETTEA